MVADILSSGWFWLFLIGLCFIPSCWVSAQENKTVLPEIMGWLSTILAIAITIVSFWLVKWWLAIIMLIVSFSISRFVGASTVFFPFASRKGGYIAGFISLALMIISLVLLCNAL